MSPDSASESDSDAKHFLLSSSLALSCFVLRFISVLFDGGFFLMYPLFFLPIFQILLLLKIFYRSQAIDFFHFPTIQYFFARFLRCDMERFPDAIYLLLLVLQHNAAICCYLFLTFSFISVSIYKILLVDHTLGSKLEIWMTDDSKYIVIPIWSFFIVISPSLSLCWVSWCH